VYVKGTPVLTP